jgi:threonine/homoserine efflux transporter RhtA
VSYTPALHRRIAGAGLVISGLLSAAIGYALTTGYSALEVSAPMQTAGAIALCAVMVFTDRSPFRRYDRTMWLLITRLAAGNAVIAFTYPRAVQRLTLGTVAAIVAVGSLAVGSAEIWQHRATTWGLGNICGRVLALGGVVLLNRPWQGGIGASGTVCALISGLCVWNTLTVLGRMNEYGLQDQGAALANLLAGLCLIGLVIALRGRGWLSWSLLSAAGAAGLLTLLLPVLFLNGALRRTSGPDVGALQSLTSPVHALVAQGGVWVGRLDTDQRITPGGWAAIILIAGATFAPSLIKKPGPGLTAARRTGVAHRHN